LSLMARVACSTPHGQLHYRLRQPERPAGAPPLVCFHMAPISGKQFLSFLP